MITGDTVRVAYGERRGGGRVDTGIGRPPPPPRHWDPPPPLPRKNINLNDLKHLFICHGSILGMIEIHIIRVLYNIEGQKKC